MRSLLPRLLTPFNHNIAEILQGYSQGYFLMADEESNSLSWFSSRQRTLIPLDRRFRYPRSLRRVLNQGRFSTAIDQAFEAVVEGCANRETTWISPGLKQVYQELHRAGIANSYETWRGNHLAGGILGLTLGGLFIGESMFYNIPDGSKVAMVKLVEHLRGHHFTLFDAQMMNPHLARFGAYVVSEAEYKLLLNLALKQKSRFL